MARDKAFRRIGTLHFLPPFSWPRRCWAWLLRASHKAVFDVSDRCLLLSVAWTLRAYDGSCLHELVPWKDIDKDR